MRRTKQKGQTLVESALVLLATLMMLLFIFDIGRAMFLGEYVTERARQTARMATVNNWSKKDVQNYLVYGKTFVSEDRWSTPGFMGLRPTQVDYAVLGTQRSGDLRVQVSVSNVQSLMFTPKFKGPYRFPTITVELPAQSMGAIN
ncbi:MAG: pilus assembly protein [Acidobacteria bacterium]|nr:pilus assembly protein [Acidobacteriota bacterium]